MKNMKKTILGVAVLAIVLIITMMGNVNAASVTAKKEVEKGKTVTVTLSMKPTSSVGFELSYDNSKFKFVGGSAENLGTVSTDGNTNGVVNVQLFAVNGTSKTEAVTLNFEATETTDAKAFTVSDFVTEDYEDMTNPTVEVAVVDPIKVPDNNNGQQNNNNNNGQQNNNNGQQGTTNNNGQQGTTTTDSKKTSETNGKVGTNGKVITKLPQTGTPVFIGVVAIIAIAGVALVAKKAK